MANTRKITFTKIEEPIRRKITFTKIGEETQSDTQETVSAAEETTTLKTGREALTEAEETLAANRRSENRAKEQRQVQRQVAKNTLDAKKGGMLGGTIRGWAAGMVGAAEGALSAPTAVNYAASGVSEQNKNALENIKHYAERRNAAETEEERAYYQNLIDLNRKRISVNDERAEREAKSYEDLTENARTKLEDTYTKLKQDAEAGIEAEKQGLGTVGNVMVDLGVAGGQMLLDAANPLGALPSMWARVYGESVQEAKDAINPNASKAKQLEGLTRAQLYGVASGTLSVATEKLSNVAAPFKKAFGGGVLDKALSSALARMNNSAAGKLALSFLSEGSEEVLEDIVSPVLQSIYNGKSIGQNYSELELTDVLYDGLIGGLMGLVGGAPEALSTAADNAAKRSEKKAAEKAAKAQQDAANAQQDTPVSKAEQSQAAGQNGLNTEQNGLVANQNGLIANQDGRKTEQNGLEIQRGKGTKSGGGGFGGSFEAEARNETVRTGRRYGVNEETIERVERIGKVVGRSILFYETDRVGENGYYDRSNGTLYINAKSDRTVSKIVGHELTHSIEESESYGDLKTLVLRRIEKTGGDLEALRQEKVTQYAEHGITLEGDGIDAEIVAEYVENNLLTDEGEINALARTNRSLLEKIAAFIDRLLAKLGNAGAQERAFLEKAQGLYRNALGETKTTQETRGKQETLRHLERALENREITQSEFEAARDALGQFSVEKTEDGKSYVRAERQVIFGNDPQSWKEQLEDYINGKIRRGQDVHLTAADGDVLTLTATSAGKLSDNHTSDGRTMSDIAYERKTNAAAHIDELAEVSTRGDKNVPDYNRRHGSMASDGWNYRTAYFEDFDGKYYEVTISVAESADGKMVYNIGQMKEEASPKVKGSRDVSANGLRGFASSEGSITENGENVKRQFSYAGEKARTADINRLKTAQEMELLGADRETVRRMTGWFRGKDGKWRYEIDDSGMEYRKNGDAQLMKEEGYGNENTVFAEDAGASYSIKRTSEMTLAEQLKMFYDGKMASSDAFYFGETPAILEKSGFEAMPLTMTIRDFRKSTKDKHNIPRRVLKNLTDKLSAPMFSFGSGDRVGILLDDIDGNGKQLLAALERGASMDRKPVNVINSLYGLEHPAEWIENQIESGKEFVLYDEKRANAFLQTYGYSASVGDGIRSMRDSIADTAENVKRQYSVSEETTEKKETEEKPKRKKKNSFTRDTIPKKAQGYLHRTERVLANSLSDALSSPKYEGSGFMRGIAQQISDEYLQTGKVSDKTRASLFEEAFEKGLIVDKTFYEKNKDVKARLRETRVTISERDQSDIADFKDFRRNAFGTLNIVDEGGTPVDVFYDRLSGMAPKLFPESITHPADQLVRMYEVGRSIQKSEWSLEKYYGEEAKGYKVIAEHEFNSAIEKSLGELNKVKRYAEDRATPEKENLPGWVKKVGSVTLDDVKRAHKGIKMNRSAYERVVERNLLTGDDEAKVERLLSGRLTLDDLDPKKDNVRGITEVYEARKEYEELVQVIRAWDATQKQARKAKADKYLETSLTWKDKSGLRYATETMERNLYDIIPDEALAKEIYYEYFHPVREGNAESVKLKDRMRKRVKELKLSRKVAEGNEVSEAYAVQLFGEATDNIQALKKARGRMAERDGKTLAEWQAVVNELWENNPNLDREKIENAVKVFREIYDELFEMMNEARLRNGYEPVDYRRGYFPHFQPESEDGVIGMFGRALGIKTEVTALPTTINGMTHVFKPGIQWFSHAQKRKGINTAYDAVEGFDRYVEGIASVICQTDNIQNLRALSSQMRYRASDEGIQKQVDAVEMSETLTEEEKKDKVEKIYKDAKYAGSSFVTELEEYTNGIANKRSRMDREMEQKLGRGMYNIAKAFNSRVGANMVAVNPGSWLTNFAPLAQANGLLGRGELLKGMWQTLQSYKESDGMVDRSSFLTVRKGSDPLVRTWAQETSATLSSPMEMIDQLTAGSIVRAFYNQGLRNGLSEAEAMREADRLTNSVMAGRGKGDMPTMFEATNPAVKLFTQFQLEVNNQLRFMLKDIPRELGDKSVKVLAMALLRFCVGSWLYDELYELLTGRRCTLDPLGILNDTVGDLTGWELPNLFEMVGGAFTGDMPSFETEKQDLYGTAVDLVGNIADQTPFISPFIGGGRYPVTSAFPDWDNLGKALGKSDWSAKKRLSTGIKSLSGTAAYTLLPFGGGQAKKVIQGLKAVIEGGSYTVDADGNDILQYPVYTDTTGQAILNTAAATIFGKTSTKTGRDWVENGYPSLSAKQTAVYQGMTELGVAQKDAWELLQSLRSAEKTETESEAEVERGILRASDISDEGKGVVYYGLLASERERALMDELDDVGEVTSLLLDIKDAETTSDKRELLEKSALSDEEKATAYRYLFGEKREDGTYTHSRLEDFVSAGVNEVGAYELSSALDRLEPEDGKKSVSNLQKYKAVADADLGSREKLGALKVLMGDTQYKRVEIATSYEIKVDTYVAYLEALSKYGKSFGQEEVEKVLDSMGGGDYILPGGGKQKLTTAQQAVLWQCANKSWSAKSNPYSRSIGKKVYALLNEG